MVCRNGAVQLLLGLAIGLPAGLAVVRVARAVLFDVQADDPIVVGAVLTVLGGAAVIACLVPALRATRVDALTVLRSD
jgi:putative ABC transport system permease protein